MIATRTGEVIAFSSQIHGRLPHVTLLFQFEQVHTVLISSILAGATGTVVASYPGLFKVISRAEYLNLGENRSDIQPSKDAHSESDLFLLFQQAGESL